MTDVPTYETLRAAVEGILDEWPNTAEWPQMASLQSLLGEAPTVTSTPLPEQAVQPVRELMEKISAARRTGERVIPSIPSLAVCFNLALWAGLDLEE
jgi:hypothetical protein